MVYVTKIRQANQDLGGNISQHCFCYVEYNYHDALQSRSKLLSLLPVGILNHVVFISNICICVCLQSV